VACPATGRGSVSCPQTAKRVHRHAAQMILGPVMRQELRRCRPQDSTLPPEPVVLELFETESFQREWSLRDRRPAPIALALG
jgi:hypothetical protein